MPWRELIWGFPNIRGTFLGVPILRIIIFWGSILGAPYFGKQPFGWNPNFSTLFPVVDITVFTLEKIVIARPP